MSCRLVTRFVSSRHQTFTRCMHTTTYRHTIALTSERYPNLKRGPYANVEDSDLAIFEKMLPGDGRVLTDSSELEGYNTDWIKTCRGMYMQNWLYYILNVFTGNSVIVLCP